MMVNIDIKKENNTTIFLLYDVKYRLDNQIIFTFPKVNSTQKKIELYCKQVNEILNKGCDIYKINNIKNFNDISADGVLNLMFIVSNHFSNFLNN